MSSALAAYRRATLSEVAYQIDLDIPAARDSAVTGRSLITFTRSGRGSDPVILDFKDPGARVLGLMVNGADAAWRAEHDHVVVDGAAFREGGNEIDIRYVAGDEALNRNDDFLYTLFVPDRAHFSLPLFDQPNLKASVAWKLTVPSSWKVVANGPLLERTVKGPRTSHTFLASRPIPAYLFAFAAGVFETEWMERDGRRITMYHRETDTAMVARNREAILDLHFRALAWLEEYTGIEYPFQKFDFVLIPPFQYGGMEHPGSVFYRQRSLMLDESATQSQILGRASLIAHETAHMWFGDLVTMNWFDDVWTKEVFANFMAAKIVHPSFPEVDHDLRFLMAHHPAAYGVDRTRGANPIRQPLDNLRFAGTLYGPIIYQKAPVVMRQLEARVGEETFREGIRAYLQRFAFGNATWPDLIDILDERVPEDLVAWSHVWVEEPDRPTVRVVREGDDVVIAQADPRGRGRVWPQTLHVRLGRTSGDSVVQVELRGESIRLRGGGRDLQFVLPNASGVEYGLFLLDDESLSYLAEHVTRLPTPLLRGAAWVTLWDAVLEGALDAETFLARVLEAVASEENELNLGRILGYAETAYWRLLNPERRRAWAPRLEAALWAEVTGGRPRTARASVFGAWRSVALTDESLARMRRLWAGVDRLADLPLGETDLTGVAEALALRGVADADSILSVQAERIENPDRKARFDFVRPSLSPDPEVRAAFFASLAEPANREREPWVLAGLSNLSHPLRAETSLGFVGPGLELLEEIQRTGDIFFPQRWLGALLEGHNTPEAAEEVGRYLDQHPALSPRLRLKVLQAADMLFRSAGIVYGWDGA